MSNSPQYNYQNCVYPRQANPNAVNINIISPTAYGSSGTALPNGVQYSYPLYGTNPNTGMYYPQNYNNLFSPNSNPYANNPMYYDYNQNHAQNPQNPANLTQAAQNPISQAGTNMANNQGLLDKTSQDENSNSSTVNKNTSEVDETNKKDDKKNEKKQIVPLTDEYIKSLENYLNDSNPKIRLIAAKDVLERFKEDENRKDNKSLMPLLNKMLRDTSASVKFLGLTALDLGYCAGNDETVQILKDMQKNSDDKTGQNQLIASQILLKMTSPERVEK